MKIFVVIFLAAVSSSAAIQTVNEDDIPELNYLDPSVNPCENFYQFTCGNFKNVHPKPDDVDVLDHFQLLKNKLLDMGKAILTNTKLKNEPTAVKKAKSAYKACVNVEYLDHFEKPPEFEIINRFGGFPLIDSVENPDQEFSWNDIADMVGRYGVQLIFNYDVGEMNKTKLINLGKDLLENPTLIRPAFERDYDTILEETLKNEVAGDDRKNTARGVRAIASFDVFLRTFASYLANFTEGYRKSEDEIIADLDDMATFMRQLYAGGIVEEGVEILPLDTFSTVRQLQNWTDLQFPGKPNINWLQYFNIIFSLAGTEITEDTMFLTTDAKYIYGALNLVQQSDPKAIKNFALLRIFLFLAPDSDSTVRKIFEDYYRSKNYKLYDRDDYCARKVMDATDTAGLSFAVTYDYERYYFDINRLSEASEVVQNLENSFKNILENADWMDENSKNAAVRKADKIVTLLGFPEFVEEKDKLNKFYENFRICEYDNYGNAYTLRAFKQAYRFSALNKDTTTFWGKSTFDTNAYYSRPSNRIILPISMLNEPYFNTNNTVIDYSRLGSIIGHEITHGFDDTGSLYDEDGLQVPWWSQNTKAAFDEKAKCFVDQYNKFYISETDSFVNGSRSLNENLADNGGVREAFEAFKSLVDGGAVRSGSDRFTWEQLFFIGYGTSWCSTESVNYLNSLAAQAYAPARFRVNGPLTNMEEFADAFGCPVGTPMNPENKCVLW